MGGRYSRLKLATASVLLAIACGEEAQQTAANRPPTLDAPPVVQGREGEPLGITLKAVDPDDDVLVFRAEPLPPGNANFDSKTGVLLWTPSFSAARTEPYTVTFTADDGRTPAQATTTITVYDVNQGPHLLMPTVQTVNEGVELSFNVTATDADTEDAVTIVNPNPVPGSTFLGGTFRWTPTFQQSGSHTVSFTATDNHTLSPAASETQSVTITVNDVNRPPRITSAPSNPVYYESQKAEFTIGKEDSDEGQLVTVSMQDLNTPPTTATVQPSGAFSWNIPPATEGTFNFKFIATDNGAPALTDERTVTLTVKLTNHPPTLVDIPAQFVDEGVSLFFTLQGKAADATKGPDAASENLNQVLEYSMLTKSGPAQIPPSSLNTVNGEFNWSPSCTAVGVYKVQFTVTDNGVPERSASKDATITVAQANCLPGFVSFTRVEDGSTQLPGPNVIFNTFEDAQFTLKMAATDRDGDLVTYSMDTSTPTPMPQGAIFNSATQSFTWKPGCTQAAAYDLRFRVTDRPLADPVVYVVQVVHVNVANVNCAPVLTRLCNQVLTAGGTSTIQCPTVEGTPFSWFAEAMDPDGDTVTYDAQLDVRMPAGAFNAATHALAWTPGCNAAGTYSASFSVADPEGLSHARNVAFVVSPGVCRPNFTKLDLTKNGSLVPMNVDADTERAIGVDEASNVSMVLTAVSPEGLPITFGAQNLPAGAAMTTDGNTATISWQPSCSQKGSYLSTLVAADDNAADRLRLAITVNETNCTPSFPNVGTKTVAEGGSLSFTLAASDPDSNDTLSDFTIQSWFKAALDLTPGPAGSGLVRQNGLFTWTPDHDAAGTHQITFHLDDHSTAPNALGQARTSTATLIIQVSDTNQVPVVYFGSSIPSPDPGDVFTAPEASAITIDVNASDDDDDTLTDFTYTWMDGAMNGISPPPGASLNRMNGLFTWTPGYRAAGTYYVTFSVNDHRASGPLKGSRTATLVINNTDEMPSITPSTTQSLTVAEGAALSAPQLNAADADGDPLSLSVEWAQGACPGSGNFSSTLPPGAVFSSSTGAGAGTGTLSWTPGFNQAGDYCFDFQALDPAQQSAETFFSVHVNDTNRQPTLAFNPPGTGGDTYELDEGTGLSFTVVGQDLDGDALTDFSMSWSGTVPSGVALNRATGQFTWNASYQAAGDYEVTFTVNDHHPGGGALTGSKTANITVHPVDTNPSITLNRSFYLVEEGSSLAPQIVATAQDADADALTVTAEVKKSVCTGSAPPQAPSAIGAIFVPSNGAGLAGATLSWTPTGAASVASWCFTFTVADANGTTATATAEVTVNDTIRPATLSFIPPGTVNGDTYTDTDESEMLQFTVAGVDADNESITDFTMQWTDIAGNPISTPAGVSLNRTSGLFTWNTNYRSSGTYNVIFTGDDHFVPTPTRVSKVAYITINNVDTTPGVLPFYTSIISSEGSSINPLLVTATDQDGDPLTLTAKYRSVAQVADCDESTVGALPPGAEFTATSGLGSASGTFRFTANYSQAGTHCFLFVASDGSGPFGAGYAVVSVNDVNRAPTLAFNPPGAGTDGSTYTMNENALLSFLVAGADQDGDALTDYTFSWSPSRPAGASLNQATGLFRFNAGYADSGTYLVTFTVNDHHAGGAAELTGSRTATITVSDVDTIPTVTLNQTTVSVDEGVAISPSIIATGNDADGDTLTLSAVVRNEPCNGPNPDTSLADYGATFSVGANTPGARTGTLDWTPLFEDSGSYCFTVRATDDDGPTVETTVDVRVVDVNRPPVVTINAGVGPDSYSKTEGQPLLFDVDATDDDNDTISDFSMAWADGAGNSIPAPPGASLSRTDGGFVWNIDFRSSGSYLITFIANDHHLPRSALGTKVVSVTVGDVNTAPAVTIGANRDAETVNEGASLPPLTVNALDAQNDVVTLTIRWRLGACGGGDNSDGTPAGALFTASNGAIRATGTLTWTPSFSQSGTYCFTFTGTDNHDPTAAASASFQLLVKDVDQCAGVRCLLGEACRAGVCQVIYCDTDNPCTGAYESCNSGRCYMAHKLAGPCAASCADPPGTLPPCQTVIAGTLEGCGTFRAGATFAVAFISPGVPGHRGYTVLSASPVGDSSTDANGDGYTDGVLIGRTTGQATNCNAEGTEVPANSICHLLESGLSAAQHTP